MRFFSRQRYPVVGAALASVLLAACSSAPLWRAIDDPGARDAARLFRSEGAAGVLRDTYPDEVPNVPPRVRLRPCCAFGAQLGVKVGPVPIPLVFLGNLVDRKGIRGHVYDAGVAAIGSNNERGEFLHPEGNGLVYTCRGGFLDIAHVRDYADATLYLSMMIAKHLETGANIELPDEGAKRRLVLRPIDPDKLAKYGRWPTAIPLGQWISYQTSVWHEIATWFGWSTFPLFPEKVSAFSPEDLYSNLVGVRIAAAILSQHGGDDEFMYERSLDRWLDRTLAFLDAVPVTTSEEAMLALDGLWWDSSKRLPDPSLVRRRYFGEAESLEPWLVPRRLWGPRLHADCQDSAHPVPIANPKGYAGIDFAKQATLEIEVPDYMATQEPFVTIGRKITQEDFPRILEFIRKENRELFGPDADRPDDAAAAAVR